MCFRIISVFLSIYLLLLFHVCFADEKDARTKRDGFGQMFKNFLSNLFGSNTNVTEIADQPANNSLNDTMQQFLTNVSESIIETQKNETETNLQSQQEVTPQENRTVPIVNMTSSVKTPASSISSEPSTISSKPSNAETTASTTTQIDENTCNNEPLLRNYCQVPEKMHYLSFWDLYSVFFSDRVIDALELTCSRGSWCLQEDNGYWESLIAERVVMATESSSIATTFCKTDFAPCLSYIVNRFENCSKYSYFMVTFEALKLVCSLRQNTLLTTTCYKQLVAALHVTLADLLRTDVKQESVLDTCHSAEANMTKGLICVENACPGESKKFHSLKPWLWFTSVEDDLMIECKLNPTKCEALLPSLTNGQADQQEVTSQENKTSTTTVSTTSTTTSTSSSSSPSTWMFSSSASPGYQIEDDRCYTDAVLQNFCPVPKDMTDVSFWELYSVFFSDSVLDALVVGCSKGSWCLKDRFDYWESLIVERVDRVMNSEIASSMCLPQIVPCVLNVASSFYNCSMYGQMVFTSEVLKLICGLKENSGLTSECYKHVISALHVTLADIMRAEEKEETGDFCEAPEAQMTQGLICVENSCPSESKTFHSFKPWAWFTSVVNDLIADCNMDRTTCKALLTPPQAYEMGAMVGISVAVMITALTLTIVVCTCYKRHRRNTVVKEGYQRLLTDGDES